METNLVPILTLACAALWGVQGVPGVRFPVSFSLFPALVCFGVWGAAAVVAAAICGCMQPKGCLSFALCCRLWPGWRGAGAGIGLPWF